MSEIQWSEQTAVVAWHSAIITDHRGIHCWATIEPTSTGFVVSGIIADGKSDRRRLGCKRDIEEAKQTAAKWLQGLVLWVTA